MTDKVKVAIAGVGNCASALVQGVQFYRDNPEIPGLMHPTVGPYKAEDIEFVAAFDVNEAKVGKLLSAAIFAPPNNMEHMGDAWETMPSSCIVSRGPTLDGVGTSYAEKVQTNGHSDVQGMGKEIVHLLRDSEADVLVNYVPVGSTMTTEFYAECALDAGCGFVNAIPVPLARQPGWRARFLQKRLPLIGDDIKSQVGATIVHRVLTQLFSDRGISLDRTYQLNVGGNMDFYNMLESSRLADKRTSKAGSVTSVANKGEGLDPKDVHIGPSDYVEWLGDRKVAFIRMEGTAFGGAPLNLELRLEVHDSPNSAGVVIDAVRFAKLAKDRGEGGAMFPVSAWLMKAPPNPMTDEAALEILDEYLARIDRESVGV